MSDFTVILVEGCITSQCFCVHANHPHVRCGSQINGPDGLCDACRSQHYGLHNEYGPIVASPCLFYGDEHRIGCGNFANGSDGLCSICRSVTKGYVPHIEVEEYIPEGTILPAYEGQICNACQNQAVLQVGDATLCAGHSDIFVPEWRELLRDCAPRSSAIQPTSIDVWPYFGA